jgi:hypothetical protein
LFFDIVSTQDKSSNSVGNFSVARTAEISKPKNSREILLKNEQKYNDSKVNEQKVTQIDNDSNQETEEECVNYIDIYEGKRLCSDEYDYKIKAENKEDLNRVAKEAALDWYKNDKEYSIFAKSEAAETILVKDSHPEAAGHDYYIVILRDNIGNITGYMEIDIKGHYGDDEYLSIGRIRPISSAIVTENQSANLGVGTTKKINKKDKFPPVDEEEANRIAGKYIDAKGWHGTVERVGYTNLYMKSPFGVEYYSVGQHDVFHEFAIDNNNEKIWIRIIDGEVFDSDRLDWISRKNMDYERQEELIFTDTDRYPSVVK